MNLSCGRSKAGGLLIRLRNDARGNVLILTAAALIPLIALVGGGIDLSRLYLVKARLQHACDAGALAGRKAMGAGSWAQLLPNPPTIANQFFDGNFKSDGMASTALTRTYSESGGKVSGVATVNVPMTVMNFFGAPTRTLTVYCASKFNIPNTDVMFVLDVTGSMADLANVGDTASKIVTLKNSVKCFYESLAQQSTNGACPTTVSSSSSASSAQVRFGFVPYNTNVNVGKLLPTSYFANNWTYQTRQYQSGGGTTTSWGPWQNAGTVSCGAVPADTASMQYQVTGRFFGLCSYQSRTLVSTTAPVLWSYAALSQNVSGLKNGTGWNNSFTLPIGTNGTAKTINWDGCIEERATVRATSYNPIPSGARDLDIDAVPSQSDPASLWAPALPDLIYTRPGGNVQANWNLAAVNNTSAEYTNGSKYYCPPQAAKMQTWSPTAFDSYVDGLTPSGNTYHDIGLLWGGRLMSPTGIFASENAQTPSGGAIQRYMIFMTDGDTNTDPGDYAAYGVPWFDRRETPLSDVPTGGGGSTGTLTQQVNLRFATICTAVKNKGIALFVVSFGGSGIAADTKTRLQTCATDTNHYYDATNAVQLQTAFQSIATQISQLRLIQ